MNEKELTPKASLTEQAVSKHCDYRRRECASSGLIIDRRWVCLNHVPEEKGHDGLTSAERMKQMTQTPEEPWPSAELQQARARIAELEQALAAAHRLLCCDYIPWSEAGGPEECEHKVAKGIDCLKCDQKTFRAAKPAEPKES